MNRHAASWSPVHDGALDRLAPTPDAEEVFSPGGIGGNGGSGNPAEREVQCASRAPKTSFITTPRDLAESRNRATHSERSSTSRRWSQAKGERHTEVLRGHIQRHLHHRGGIAANGLIGKQISRALYAGHSCDGISQQKGLKLIQTRFPIASPGLFIVLFLDTQAPA